MTSHVFAYSLPTNPKAIYHHSEQNTSVIKKPRIAYDYWGLSYQQLFINTPNLSSSAPKSLGLTLGHHLDPTTAVEFLTLLPSSEETVTWNSLQTKQSVDFLVNTRLRKGMINYSGFEFYGLLGLNFISLQYTNDSNTLDQAEKMSLDIHYGVGTRFRLGQSALMGHIEYTHLLNSGSLDLSSLGLGISYYY